MTQRASCANVVAEKRKATMEHGKVTVGNWLEYLTLCTMYALLFLQASSSISALSEADEEN